MRPPTEAPRRPRPLLHPAPTAGALLTLLFCFTSSASAQLLSLRTVPLAAGNQFNLAPADRGGMGGVTIALDDRLLDPFINPALGRHLEGSTIAGSPAFYGFDVGERGGRTLPVTGLFSGDRWFGGATLALQQLLHDNRFGFQPGICCFPPQVSTLSDRSSTNLYSQAFLGRASASGRWSWGVGLELASLDAVDGVELLYNGSERIDQAGSQLTLRGGLTGTFDGSDQWELAGAFRRFRMRHDVTWADWRWAPGPWDDAPILERRLERNLDRTNTWGVDGKYSRPLSGTDWKVGGQLTVNYKDHPKIPNYQIVNIPRDPGHSWVYNLGVGMSRETETTVFGFDLVLEPAWSDTWAEALDPVRRVDGVLIPSGGKTIENDFTFLNSKLRVGFEQSYDALALQLGLGVSSIDYDLTQLDRVNITLRDATESWIEWTPSWGLTLSLDEAQIRYAGWTLLGAGVPGVNPTFREGGLDAAAATPDIVVAASGPLTLQDVRVTTHQITVSMPLR